MLLHGRRILALVYLVRSLRVWRKMTHLMDLRLGQHLELYSEIQNLLVSADVLIYHISSTVVFILLLFVLGGAVLFTNVVSSNGLHLKSFLYPPHVTLLL